MPATVNLSVLRNTTKTRLHWKNQVKKRQRRDAADSDNETSHQEINLISYETLKGADDSDSATLNLHSYRLAEHEFSCKSRHRHTNRKFIAVKRYLRRDGEYGSIENFT